MCKAFEARVRILTDSHKYFIIGRGLMLKQQSTTLTSRVYEGLADVPL